MTTQPVRHKVVALNAASCSLLFPLQRGEGGAREIEEDHSSDGWNRKRKKRSRQEVAQSENVRTWLCLCRGGRQAQGWGSPAGLYRLAWGKRGTPSGGWLSTGRACPSSHQKEDNGTGLRRGVCWEPCSPCLPTPALYHQQARPGSRKAGSGLHPPEVQRQVQTTSRRVNS